MRFLISKPLYDMGDSDLNILYGLIRNSRIHSAEFIGFDGLRGTDIKKTDVPLGSIQFVGEYLRQVHGVDKMNPVEVPECLRKQRFLNRTYKIIGYRSIVGEASKINNGDIFLKDVSTLKRFSASCNIDTLIKDGTLNILDKDANYLISEKVDILSEYRVYVFEGEILNISNYNGSVLLYPDTSKILEMVIEMGKDKTCPISYTMDVMIDSKGETSIIEVHPLAAVGLYSTLFPTRFLYGYHDGIEYYTNVNKKVERTE